jgi:cobalamin biosynthesis protein CobT
LAGAEQTGAVAKGFGLGAALRAVSRDRAVVDVVDIDGTTTTGTIDAVGQDLLEVAEHAVDLPRRAENVVAVRAVPFAALAAVRRR